AKPGATLAALQVERRLREAPGQDITESVEASGSNRRETGHRALEVSAFEEPADRVGVRASGQLQVRHRPQRQERYPAGQGFADAPQGIESRRPRDEECARASLVIDRFLDGQQQFRNSLDLVDSSRKG